ncbi:glycosyltransferase family 2 protein [Microbacterium sp. zg.B48]|uniref:glycosyltransferase family 2 protein n=1 Tax=unclassified Microbacterium TaxID=2609290 RepID=UPI00214A8CFF|nr:MULTISPECIES: glycosyltransferase family A protein [unclassified Microbacterium]MCR2764203.1 glycosyltransferase family 2 protein [Microbacterium sp. zg.B48]MCR2808930.1 glycosyltransferase family 2 protein [Microbacterium sp. zg.B185]WIM20897.1 glycosyltransferase family A protein [Microbacterium sp. zg-B185]
MRVYRPMPMRRRPTVTVVIPHFNYGQYLPTAVGSALDQRGLDVEVIIVDDRSTDGSTEAARRIASADERVTLVEHEQNMRHIRTYNDGLSRASGDYVVLLSADDALTPNSLTRSVALMEAHPRVGLVYGGVEWFHGELPAARGGRGWWQVWGGDEWTARLVRRGRNAVVNPEAVLRRSVYEATGGYNPDFPHSADMYMWLQAAAVSDVGFVAGPRQAYYRDHGQNMHSTEHGGLLDDMAQVLGVYERFFAHDGAVIRRAPGLIRTAKRSVAREALLRGALLTADGAPTEVLVQMQDFARATAPEIVRSAVWRWAELTAQDGAPARLVGSVENLRWKIRSRRHLEVGL